MTRRAGAPKPWFVACFALSLTAACSGTPDVDTVEICGEFRLDLAAPQVWAGAEDGALQLERYPVTTATVALESGLWEVQAAPDAEGRVLVEVPCEDAGETTSVRVEVAGHPAISVYHWPLDHLELLLEPLPEPRIPGELRAVTWATVRGNVEGWSPSGIGQGNEVRVAWRHAEGLRAPPETPADDLTARASIQGGSGSVVCEDTDPPRCYDPGDAADGVSGISFHPPPGLVEFGLVERIVDGTTRRTLELAALDYDPTFPVPSAGLGGQIWTGTLDSDPWLCPDSTITGAQEIWLDGLGRQYVIASRGGLRLSLHLRSPFGMRLPLLVDEEIPQTEVFGVAGSVERQRVSLRYPFPLTDALEGFSYGYRAEATSVSSAVGGATRYHYRLLRTSGGGHVAPCRITIPARTMETAFSSPTLSQPLRLQAERTLSWDGPGAPLRRIEVHDADGRLQEILWIVGGRANRIELHAGIGMHWRLEPGMYTLTMRVPEMPPEVGPDLAGDLLLRPEILWPERFGGLFEQVHEFRVE